MKTLSYLFAIAIALILLGGCGLISKKYTKSASNEFDLNSVGKTKIRLENITGDITISKSSDSNLLKIKAYMETKVKKKFLDTPFDEIKINIDTNTNEIVVKTVFNDKGRDGLFKFGNSEKVDYNIYLPENLKVDINNINGDIFAGNIGNNVVIENINGNADFKSFHGKLECDLTNGSVTGEIDSTKGMNINLVNGNITLKLSNYLNASIQAETLNGRITDENLELSDIIKDKKKLKAKIGTVDSEIEIKLETVNGKIKLFGFKAI